jgi:excisionase family DNA binding protein
MPQAILEINLKEFLTIDELSQYLNIKRSTLYSMVESEEITHYRVGRLIRFKKQDVDAWMERHRREENSADKKAKVILKAINKPVADINRLVKKSIEEVKGNGYTSSHRETRPIRNLRKEVSDGTL